MLSLRTKIVVKSICRGWSAADVARHYGVVESTVSKAMLAAYPPRDRQMEKEVKPLFSGSHYMNLCWLRLYLDESSTATTTKRFC